VERRGALFVASARGVLAHADGAHVQGTIVLQQNDRAANVKLRNAFLT
jgi:hypothetical protein